MVYFIVGLVLLLCWPLILPIFAIWLLYFLVTNGGTDLAISLVLFTAFLGVVKYLFYKLNEQVEKDKAQNKKNS